MREFAEYVQTRLLNWRIALLWLLVAAAAAIGAAPVSAADWLRLALLTMLLIAQLRLWDDLADLPHDRVHHPDRVLVRAARLHPFVLALAAMMIATAAVLVAEREAWRIATYLALIAVLSLLYHGGIGASLGRMTRASVVLLKYPVMALLVAAGPPAWPALSGACALYLLVFAHDFREHRRGAAL